MIRSLNTGVGGIRNFQTSLDVIANNLANLNTVGFKGGRVDFAEALTQTVRPATPDLQTSGSSSIQISNGVNTNSVTTLFTIIIFLQFFFTNIMTIITIFINMNLILTKKMGCRLG